MAKSSSSMETVKISAQNEALTDGQVTRQGAVRNNEYQRGRYLFIPMNHFCVDAQFNGRDVKSKRVLCFKLDNENNIEYPRSWKISYFTESLAALKEQGIPTVAIETREGGLRRPAQGVLTYTPSTTSRVPKSIVGKKGAQYLHIDAPFIIDYKGIAVGFNPVYEQENGLWQVQSDDNGNVKFQATNITQFDVLSTDVPDALVAEAKRIAAADAQFKGVKVD